MFWLMFLIGLVIGIVALFAMSLANAAAMCTDEYADGEAARIRFERQAGERRRLREEDATPW